MSSKIFARFGSSSTQRSESTVREKVFPQTFEGLLEALQTPDTEITYYKHFEAEELEALESKHPLPGKKKLKVKTHTLILEANNLQDEGARILAETILVNNSYTRRLELNSNKIAAAGAQGIADALKSNKNLHTLGLSNNKLDSDAIERLAPAIVDHKNLKTVSFKGNPFQKKGFLQLKRAVDSRSNLSIIGADNKVIRSKAEVNSGDEETELTTEVGKILESNGFEKYARKFFIRNVNTVEDALMLTSEDYSNMGIEDASDMAEIEKIFRPSTALTRTSYQDVQMKMKLRDQGLPVHESEI